ncbi:MAG: GDSL-type esterase/lipase family protein [Planctomycetota bacterium]
MQPPLRRIGLRLLLAGGAALSGLIVAEVALRGLQAGAPPEGSPLRLPGGLPLLEPFGRWDRDLGYALVPGSRAFPEYRINAAGWRGADFLRERRPGTLRLVTMGDSSTFAMGVREEDGWPARLQQALSGLFAGQLEVELINAGVPGYSTLLNRVQLERDVLPLQPDVVVALLTGQNDTRLVQGRTDAEMAEHNRSWAVRLRRWRVVRLLLGAAEESLNLWPVVHEGAANARRRVPLEMAQEQLAAMRAAAESAGAHFVVVLLAPPPAVAAAEPILVEFGAAIAQRAQELGLPLADARPEFRALFPHPLFVDNVHPTPQGHRLLAFSVLQRLLATMPWPAGAAPRAELQQAAVSRRAELGLPLDVVDARFGQALELASRDRPAALALLDEVLADTPRDVEALFQRAWLGRGRGAPDATAARWQRVADLDPAGVHGLFAAGLLALEAGRAQEALTTLQAALAVRPSFGPARYLAGRALLQLERPSEAVRELLIAQALLGPLPELAAALERLAATPLSR